MESETRAKKFKVWIRPYGDSKWYSNAMEYDTEEEAEKAGLDLFTRWAGAEEWEIRETIIQEEE